MQVMEHLDSKYERDELTGLLSMDGIIHYIQSTTEDRFQHCCMVYMTIPKFKTLNLNYGYEHGNRFLHAVAGKILEIFSSSYPARESSHHFVIVIPDMNPDLIIENLEKLQAELVKIPRGSRMILKAGIAQCDRIPDVFGVLDRAKLACSYAEKNKESFQIYSDEVSRVLELQHYLLRNFEQACENGAIQPFYQAEIRVLTKECCGYEALARWIDPVYGVISPGVFIPLLEQEALIHKLDLHIVWTVCRDIRKALDHNWKVVPVSVNLSRVDFRLMDAVKEIEKCREEYDIPRELLHIEITESAIAHGRFMAGIIDQFRELGYQIWMDDFGSGYSSLNNLQMYHFDVLKIDMSFLRQLSENPRTGTILASVINMAKRLGMETLAEGVETQEQYDFLLEAGCEKLQGFLFSRPVQLPRDLNMDLFQEKFSHRFEIEKPSSSRYYSRIGKINLLSATPMIDKPLEVKNRIPMTIIETTDAGEIHFLYANEAYNRFLHAVQIKDIDAAQGRANVPTLAENTAFLRLARRAEEGGRIKGELLINGVLFNNEVMFISREGDRAAFLVIVMILGESAREIQSEGIRLAEQYVLSSFFRVDLFDEDGTVTNLYLDADQAKLTELDSDSDKIVRQYAERYIAPEESESFCEFYDMTTVLERVKKSGGHHVKKYFHSAIPGQEGRLEGYTIMPFRVMHRWKYLSCCQYAELPPRELLEEFLGK